VRADAGTIPDQKARDDTCVCLKAGPLETIREEMSAEVDEASEGDGESGDGDVIARAVRTDTGTTQDQNVRSDACVYPGTSSSLGDCDVVDEVVKDESGEGDESVRIVRIDTGAAQDQNFRSSTSVCPESSSLESSGSIEMRVRTVEYVRYGKIEGDESAYVVRVDTGAAQDQDARNNAYVCLSSSSSECVRSEAVVEASVEGDVRDGEFGDGDGIARAVRTDTGAAQDQNVRSDACVCQGTSLPELVVLLAEEYRTIDGGLINTPLSEGIQRNNVRAEPLVIPTGLGNATSGDGDNCVCAVRIDAGTKPDRDIRSKTYVYPGTNLSNEALSPGSELNNGEVRDNDDCLSSSWMTENEEQIDEVRAIAVAATNETAEAKSSELTLEVIAGEQETDQDINPVLQAKKQNIERPTWDQIASESPITKALWQQWDRLLVRDNVLYRQFDPLNGKPIVWQLIIPYKLRRQFFQAVHEGITGGHMGRKRTEQQLQNRAYWPGWTTDVRRYMRMCGPCSQYHRGKPPKISTLKPLPVGDVWERISIDITGPHPRSRNGNVFLLTIMDHYSKWADAIPIPNHTAATVARVLFNRVLVYMGNPIFLLSDQGPEFESALFQQLCKRMGIEKMRTTPYQARTNGMVERYHRSLNSILAKIISDDQRDWCERAPVAAAAYRASVHEATGYSPNFLMLGRETRSPIDVVLGSPPGNEPQYSSIDEYVEKHMTVMHKVYATVRQHLGIAANRRKDYYNRNVKPMSFNEGTWVWYLYPRRRVGMSPKWQKFYIGPYLIVRVLPPNDLILQKSRKSKPFVVHKDKAKLFLGDPPASWIRLRPAQKEVLQPDTATVPNEVPVTVLPDDHADDPLDNVPPTMRRRGRLKSNRRRLPSHSTAPETGSRRLHSQPIDIDGPSTDFNSTSRDDADRSRINDSLLDDARSTRHRHKPLYLQDYHCCLCRSGMPPKKKLNWDKPRFCPVRSCNIQLSRASSLRRHVRQMHPELNSNFDDEFHSPDYHSTTHRRHGSTNTTQVQSTELVDADHLQPPLLVSDTVQATPDVDLDATPSLATLSADPLLLTDSQDNFVGTVRDGSLVKPQRLAPVRIRDKPYLELSVREPTTGPSLTHDDPYGIHLNAETMNRILRRTIRYIQEREQLHSAESSDRHGSSRR